MEPSYTDSRYINVSHKHGSRGYHMALLFSCFELSLLKGKEEKQQLCCSGKGPSFPTMLWGPSSHRLAGLGNSVTLTPDFHSVISELLKLVFYPLFQCLLTQESGKWERKGGQASVASSSSMKAVTNTNYASQTCVWADLFSLWINAEWPTFLHIIYYLGCYFIDFETVLLQRNGKI